MKRILIAIPSGGKVEEQTLVSIYNMEAVDNIKTDLKIFYSYAIDDNRNTIVKYALENRYDGLLFVDADMSLPKDTLKKLTSANQNVVSGIYVKKKDDKKIEAFMKQGNNARRLDHSDLTRSIIEVHSFGFGCVLIKIEVLKRMTYPYFKYIRSQDGSVVIGEDMFFCKKAFDMGLKLHIVTDLRVGHIGKQEYNL
jgi:GT2 family glycosyltransferase